jgi:hypothetical protein
MITASPSHQLRCAQPLRRRINQSAVQISPRPFTPWSLPLCYAFPTQREEGGIHPPMPTSVATHASLLKAAVAAPAHFHPKPFFSPRAAASAARIPPPPAVLGHRLPTATTTVASGAVAAVGRWFRLTPAVASARGLCAAAPHSGDEGMGSDGAEVTRRPVTPAVNGVAKDVPAMNGLSKEDRPSPAPPRLLTLPTVLTIGRVAAVPLLISSKRDSLLFRLFSFFDIFRVFLSMIIVCCIGNVLESCDSLGAVCSYIVAM